MFTHTIKSKFSKNYYTNFRIITEGETLVVTYDLIDARREQVSRTYVYVEGDSTITSIHTNKWEREISVSGLQDDLWLFLNELLQREHERIEREEQAYAFKIIEHDLDEVPYHDTKRFNYATLMMINLVLFLILFFFGVYNIVEGASTNQAIEGLVSCVASLFPMLSSTLLYITYGDN